MKKILLIALLTTTILAQGQPVYVDRIGFKLESIADIDIGWMKIYTYPSLPKAKQLGDRKYSEAQINYSQQFIQWMQQTYIPRGCLGDASYYQNAIPKFSSTNSRLGNAINSHIQALPLMYGAASRMYMFLKKDAAGKFVPQNNLAEYWHIEANQLQYISMPVSFISSTDQYYFVLPDYRTHPKGYESDDKAASNTLGFNNHNNIGGYNRFYLPPKTVRESGYYVVIMTRDNELPFEKVTIGEFFTQAEKQIPVWQNISPVSADQLARAYQNLARLKEKYKNQWGDVAKLKLSTTGITLQDFVNATEGYDDMFDNKDSYGNEGSSATFPILKVKKTALELCKKDQPQWVVIRWSMGMPNQPFNHHLHESILNNFNFAYVYNYFFHPEKVKGEIYKPLRSPLQTETPLMIEASAKSKQLAADKNVIFFDDFSTTVPGNKPTGWGVKLANAGTTSLVTKPGGLAGNWAELRGHYMSLSLKKTLPQDFTFSYDLAASQNFTWGAKGLTMQLSYKTTLGNEESYVQVKLRPGSGGRNGEVTVEAKFPSPPGYLNGTKWYVAEGFSNDKMFNKVKVTVKKKNEMLEVFIDDVKIAAYEKAIPLAHPFNFLSFDCNGNSAETDKYFISNIKITKD